MSWEQVPAKLTEYRNIEYGGDVAADRLLAAYGVLDGDINMIPAYRRDAFEDDLDYRLGACRELVKSKAWSPDTLRKV